jgi:hypothetical protein
MMEDVSLLDISAGFRLEHSEEGHCVQRSQISLANETFDFQ